MKNAMLSLTRHCSPGKQGAADDGKRWEAMDVLLLISSLSKGRGSGGGVGSGFRRIGGWRIINLTLKGLPKWIGIPRRSPRGILIEFGASESQNGPNMESKRSQNALKNGSRRRSLKRT